MSELKRCPACGGEARYIGKQVMCCKCSYTIFEHGSTEAAIKAWNNQPRIEQLYKKAWSRVKEENKRAIDAEQRNKELEKALENMVNYYIESTDPRDRGLEFPYLQQQAEQLLKGGE